MIIRPEKPDDYDAVYNVVKKAFQTAEHSDGNEQNLVDSLRKSNSFIPELSLIAVEDKEIAGHILFTKANVGENTVLALAPLSVLPKYQRKGIGLALIKEGHQIAAKMGFDYSIVLGNPKYYSKAGYVPASVYGIKASFDVLDENFMAIQLNDNAKIVEGLIKYDEAFEID